MVEILLWDLEETPKDTWGPTMSKIRRLIRDGHDIKKRIIVGPDGQEGVIRMWLEFETEEDMLMFKLTYL